MTKTGIGVLKKVYPVLASPETCTGCSICKNACPVEAITMEALATMPN
jgi:NAD-dependent dihydropyrimidine dehydrogenase PreA subunit